MSLHNPVRFEVSKDGSGHTRCDRQHRLPSIFLRFSSALLLSGGFLMRYCMIGPVGMRRIWKCAEIFERWAERDIYPRR
jgi:hypothetical protein